jgi:hypothetical protein
MSNRSNVLSKIIIAGCLVWTSFLAGCEQRPAETDPPPTTPGQRSPDRPGEPAR